MASNPENTASNPIDALTTFEQRVRDCLGFVRRMKLEQPLATVEDASHDEAFMVSAEQYELLYRAVCSFGRSRTGVEPDRSLVPNPSEFLYDKRRGTGFEPSWWKGAEQTYLWLLDWLHRCILYVQTIDHRPPSYQMHFAGDLNMGDIFKNIKNSTIIKDATVENSFNSLRQQGKPEAAELLLKIGNAIASSNNVAAAAIYEKFAEEAKKPVPDKGILRSCWDGIVAIVPPIADLASAAVKVFELGK